MVDRAPYDPRKEDESEVARAAEGGEKPSDMMYLAKVLKGLVQKDAKGPGGVDAHAAQGADIDANEQFAQALQYIPERTRGKRHRRQTERWNVSDAAQEPQLLHKKPMACEHLNSNILI